MLKHVVRGFTLFASLLSCGSNALAGNGMSVHFGRQGIDSIQYGGTELIVDGEVELRAQMTMQDVDQVEIKGEPKPEIQFMDGVLHEHYGWGNIDTTYRADGDRLFMDVDVKNGSKASIRLIDLALLRLKLPGWEGCKAWQERWPRPVQPADNPQIVTVGFDGGTMLYCGEDVDRPLGLDVSPVKDAADTYDVVLRYEGPPIMGGTIDPGDSRVFKVSIRFGAKGAVNSDIAGDIYQRYAENYPATLNWADRRAIGVVHLSSSAMGIAKNPRGWFMDRTDLDVTTAAGVEAFHQRLLKYADGCIEFTKAMNAQGIIVWDIEGQEMPHMISYIGDPRLMEQMAPEMAGVADAFMKKFTDAGLRVGVTVRPSRVVSSPGAKNRYEHIQADDVVDELSKKIDYAHKRWGCTLFYVDSTVTWINEPDGKLALKVMPAEDFHVLASRFPDCLLIPEQSATRHWAYCACYHELQQGYASTPANVLAAYPNAFSVLRVVDSGLDVMARHHDELVAAVKRGDILLYRTWWNDPYDAEIKKIYDEAKN